jgi:hypothetical protein
MFNLFTCAQGHSNTVNGLLGVVPPTVEDYFCSANNNLLLPIVNGEGEEDNFGLEPENAWLKTI